MVVLAILHRGVFVDARGLRNLYHRFDYHPYDKLGGSMLCFDVCGSVRRSALCSGRGCGLCDGWYFWLYFKPWPMAR